MHADGYLDSHQNLITFWPICNVPWNCIQIHSVVFASNRQICKQNVCENN